MTDQELDKPVAEVAPKIEGAVTPALVADMGKDKLERAVRAVQDWDDGIDPAPLLVARLWELFGRR